MKLRCNSIFLAVVVAVSFAAGGRAEDAPTKPAEEAPATRPNRAPLDFGFPRPEREFPGFRFRGEEGTRGTIRLPEGVSLMSTAPAAGRLITVEVILAEMPASGSGKEMSAERIAELEKGGQLVSQSRYWVSLVENQRSELQFAERMPVIGRMNIGGGRGVQESVTYENVGTKLRLLGRLEGDAVLVQMELDQTRLIPAPAKAEGEGAENANRHRTATTTFQSTLTISPGKTVVAGGRETPGDRGKTQTWVLVSARAEGERREAGRDSPIKIFRLIEANAVSLAAMLRGIFAGENVQIGVDERTNSVIARGDEKTLRVIQGILAALDERDLKKADVKK